MSGISFTSITFSLFSSFRGILNVYLYFILLWGFDFLLDFLSYKTLISCHPKEFPDRKLFVGKLPISIDITWPKNGIMFLSLSMTIWQSVKWKFKHKKYSFCSWHMHGFITFGMGYKNCAYFHTACLVTWPWNCHKTIPKFRIYAWVSKSSTILNICINLSEPRIQLLGHVEWGIPYLGCIFNINIYDCKMPRKYLQ